MKKILILDDDKFILDVISEALAREPFQTEAYNCAEKALEQLKTEHFDAVISDVNMPGKNGLDFAKTLREHGNSIPILMISGESFSTKEANYLNQICKYADEVLGKPFSKQELINTLKNIISD